jgi:hypothetical protein
MLRTLTSAQWSRWRRYVCKRASCIPMAIRLVGKAIVSKVQPRGCQQRTDTKRPLAFMIRFSGSRSTEARGDSRCARAAKLVSHDASAAEPAHLD